MQLGECKCCIVVVVHSFEVNRIDYIDYIVADSAVDDFVAAERKDCIHLDYTRTFRSSANRSVITREENLN